MRLTEEQVVEKFWAEQVAKRERREAIAAMPRDVERMEAVMADAWSRPYWDASLFDSAPLLFRNPAIELDGWLAEDGRIPEVRDALGVVKQRWQTPSRLRRLRAFLSIDKKDDWA